MALSGINLIGHITSNLGLGVAARNTAGLLTEMNVPFAAVDVPTPIKRTNRVDAWDSCLWSDDEPAPYDVNLFHLNPPEVAAQVRFQPSWLEPTGRVNAIVPFWELSILPPHWVSTLRLADVIVAPTRFVEGLARAADLGGIEIIHFPQTADIPDGVAPDRARWGFAEGDVVFVGSFDLSSDASRKNPVGAVAAFRAMRASADAPTAERAKLVLKVNNPSGDRFQVHRLEELRRLCGDDPAIRIIAESLPYADVLSLYASADVFVSLHRAEGLGLGLLESMLLGTPVLATGYSGNLDFMSDADSRLVRYTMVPVEGTSIGAYDPRYVGPGQQWAEPDVADAARGMLELMDDGHRELLAATARQAALATRFNPARRGAMERLLELAEEPPADSRLSELQTRPALYWRLRTAVGSLLRSAGLRQ